MINFYKIDNLLSDHIEWKGSEDASTIIVIHNDEYEKCSVKLNEILKAVHLESEKDIQLALISSVTTFELSQLVNDNSIRKILSFGWPVNQLAPNMEGKYYQLINTEYYQWLPAPLLSDVLKDKQHKMALWKTLQQMYLK